VADFEYAFKWMLPHEGGYANNPNDKGGPTNYGITQSVARGNGYAGDMRDLPLDIAKTIYRQSYWRYDGVTDNRIAAKAFDIGVNMGVSIGVRLLQEACNILGEQLRIDAVIGPETLEAVNRQDPDALLAVLCERQKARYESIIAAAPSQVVWQDNWFHRAEAVPALA